MKNLYYNYNIKFIILTVKKNKCTIKYQEQIKVKHSLVLFKQKDQDVKHNILKKIQNNFYILKQHSSLNNKI